MRSWAALCRHQVLPACGEAPFPPSLPAAELAPLCGLCRQAAGPAHECGLARWCGSCGRGAGPEHRCERTAWCGSCRREVGEGHVCGRTALCPAPVCRRAARLVEGGPRHRCGRTSYCLSCGTDRGPDHDCEARTFYCPRCDADVGDEHACGRSLFCAREECRRERLQGPGHVHGSTRYCRTCDRELPLNHRHPARDGSGFPRKG